MLIPIFLLSQPSLGIELTTCTDCHGKIKPISPDKLVKDCMTCHGELGHEGTVPTTRNPEEVHWIHGAIRKKSDRKDCQNCHRDAPISCTRCHSSHETKGLIKVRDSIVNMSNMSTCVDCHGKLPQPGGHSNFREILSNSKHQWMNCRTCHLNFYDETTNKSYKFELHFGDLAIVPIDNSTNLCKICHSPQYKGLEEGTHGKANRTCVSCHNPHTTKFGPTVRITPKETPVNISMRVESAGNWITTKVPILKNTVAVIIILLIIAMTVAEYILTRDEEGKRTAYNTVKIRGNEDKLKTLEIKLKNQNIGIINDILEESGIGVLGMTMTQEEDKDIYIYKYVIFVNVEKPIDEKDEKVLVDKITAMENVGSAMFTEKYEL